MSEANVELVRRVYEAVERGDAETVLDLYDPEIVLDFGRSPFRRVFNQDVYQGHDDLRSFFRERYEDWRRIEDELEELIDADEQVVSVVTTRGRGRVSGAEVGKRHAGVWTFRDGRIVRAEWMSLEEALEAAGVER